MPLVAVTLLVLWDARPGHHTALWLAAAAAGAAVGLLLVTALLGRAGPLLRLVTLAERLWGWARQRLRRTPPAQDAEGAEGGVGTVPATGWTDAGAALLAGTDQLVRRRWAELSWGMAGYWLLQGVLLWLCLDAIGVHPPLPVVLAGLVAERALTLLAITPGGAGVVEAGTIAVLIALGTDPTGALAGVLLFRAFVFAAEIPVGGLATALWLLTRRSPARAAV